jgi:membrane protein implicated in regulation of membrane protease activity
MWIIWLVLAAIFVVAEVFTPGFVLLWFGVGAAVAAVLALLGVQSLAVQILSFLAVSVLLVLASRTIFEQFFTRATRGNELRTGVALMIGQTCTVTEASRGALNEAAVKAYGSVWTALPLDGEAPLQEGESVVIERIEGNTVYVRRPARRAPLFGADSE